MRKILEAYQKSKARSGIRTERKEQQTQQVQALQYKREERGIVAEAYEVSRDREQMEKEVAAHPNIFKKGYQWGQSSKLKELRKKDMMGEMVGIMTADLEIRLEKMEEKDPDLISNAFCSCMESHAPANIFLPDQLLPDHVERPREFTELCEIITALQNTSASRFSREEGRELIRKYLGLDLPWGEASSAHYLKETNEKSQFWGAQLLERDPASCYVILFQCASVALLNSLNFVDRSQIHMPVFSALCAISMTATQAAASICVSDIFEERRTQAGEELRAEYEEAERRAAEERRKARQERAEKVRLLNLKELIQVHHGKKEWFADLYEPCLRNALNAMLTKKVSGADSDADTTQMRREAERVLERLDADLGVIESYLNTHPEYHLGLSRLKEKLCALLGGKLDMETIGQQVRAVLNGESTEDPAGLTQEDVERLIRDNPESMDVSLYRRRKEAFLKKIPELASPHMKEFWENDSLQNLILYAESEEAFETYLAEAAKQAEVNEACLRSCVEKKLLKCSREKALKELKHWFGPKLLMGYPALIESSAMQFLTHLNAASAEVFEIEQTMREMLKKAAVPAFYADQVQDLLIEKNADLNDKAGLEKLILEYKGVMEQNLAHFTTRAGEGKFAEKDWKDLFAWKDASLFQNPEIFAQALQEKMDLLLTQQDPGAEMSWNQYLYEHAERQLKSAYVKNKDRLQQELCGWKGFNGIFETEENGSMLMEAVKTVLKEHSLQAGLSFMKDIDNPDALDNLKQDEFRELCLMLQVNLSKTAVRWNGLRSETAAEIKKHLLLRMLTGELKDEASFDQAFIKENRTAELQIQAQKQRTAYLLGGTKGRKGHMEYRYLLVQTKKKGQMEERVRHFSNARIVWKDLYSKDDPEQIRAILELNQWLLKQYKGEEKDGPIDEYLWYHIRGVQGKADRKHNLRKKLKEDGIPENSGQYTSYLEAAGQIEQSFNRIWEKGEEMTAEETEKARRDIYMEFLMCGMEEAVYQPGKAYEKEFTGEEKAYRESLKEKSRIMLERSLFLEELLGEICKTPEQKKQIPELRERLSVIVGGIEPVDGAFLSDSLRKENRRRFGVETLDELKEVLQEYAAEGAILDVLKQKDAVQYAARRKTQMEQYKNGVFRGLVPTFMEHDEVWSHVMQDEDDAFEDYLEKLDERLEPLTRLLNGGMFREHMASMAAFIHEHESEILKEHKDPDYWNSEMTDFSRSMLVKEAGGSTLEARLEKAEKKYGSALTMRILTAVINQEEDAFQNLYEETAMETMLERGKKLYDANMKFLQSELKKAEEKPAFTAPFIQYMAERCILTSEKEFQAHYGVWYREYKDQLERQPIVFDNRRLIRLKEHQARVAEKTLEGIIAEKEQREQLQNLREQAYQIKSPILAKAGRTEPLEEKEVERARWFVNKKWQDAPELVQDLMVEELLKLRLRGRWKTALEECLPSLEQKAAWLTEQNQKLKDGAEADGSLQGLQRERYLLFMSLHAKEQVPESSEDPKALLPKFEQRQTCVQTIMDMQKLTNFEFLRREIRDTADCLNMGLYTMEDQAFEDFYKNRKHYFESAELACQIIQERTEKVRSEHGYAWNSQQMQAGLREYFRKEILEGIEEYGIPLFRENVDACLKQEEMHGALMGSRTSLGSVSSDDLRAEERSGAAVTREQFEEKLAVGAKEKLLKQYNALSRVQRELFALVLMLPGQLHISEKLVSGQLVAREMEMDAAAGQRMKQQILDYIRHQPFAPDLSYAKAMGRLFRQDGTLDETVFEQAMAFTRTCMMQYQMEEPKDWERMNEGSASVKRAVLELRTKRPKQCSGIEHFMEQTIEGPEQFLRVLSEIAVQDEKTDILEKLHAMDETEAKLLIAILQRRSALDRTTGDSESMLEYADPQARAELLEKLKGEEEADLIRHAASSEAGTQALRSLLAFQLRDDINLTGRFLEKDDFASGALKRETILDWKLFERALNTRDELIRHRARILALRQTTGMIEHSGNEKAIQVYREYRDVTDLTQDGFDEFLKKQALADQRDKKSRKEHKQISALMAGYYALDKNQKRLFMRALQNRDILDVSKEQFLSSYFGLTERDYVNPQERDSLANEYLRNISSEQNQISLPTGYEKSALLSLLSRQIDDSADYSDETLILKEQMGGALRRNRNTAVDWKLFARALQFVNRTSTEAQILLQDRELYVSRGDLKEHGTFRFEGEYLRRNLHTAGNRASHVMGRMIKKKIQDKIPGYSFLQKLAVELSDQAAAAIDTYGLAVEEEEKEGGVLQTMTGINEKVGDLSEKVKEKDNAKYLKYVLSEEMTEKVQDKAELINEISGNIGTVGDVLEALGTLASSVSNVLKLRESEQEGEQKARFDQEDKEEAARHQTKKQQERGEAGEARNVRGVDTARFSARQNQYREAFNALKDVGISLAKQFGGESVEFYTEIAETAVECAYCIHQFFVDHKVVEQYFNLKDTMDKNPQLKKIRESYESSDLKKEGGAELEGYSARELYQTAMGFETFDELAAQAGFEVVRSLLFSAGPYNPIRKNRICSSMILHVLGFGQLIGRQDSQAALMIYEKLSGKEYK